jgi:predicted nicotinamide N-methyase
VVLKCKKKKMRSLEVGERELQIIEGLDGSYDGATVWDAALVLCKYIAKASASGNPFAGKTAIELGSGTGIVGIAAAACGGNLELSFFSFGATNIEINLF